MERFALTFGRLALAGIATAGAVVAAVIVTNGYGSVGLLAAAALVVLGVILNRAWVALVPLALIGGLLGWSLIEGPSDGHDFTFATFATFLAVVAIAVSLCLLAGIGLRRLGRARQRSSFSPQ